MFLDVEAIDSGQFENVILNQIGQCEHFVVLLTTGTARDLGRAGDWVTKELERALELERNVIPILVDDASIEDVSEAFSRRGELLTLNFLHLTSRPVRPGRRCPGRAFPHPAESAGAPNPHGAGTLRGRNPCPAPGELDGRGGGVRRGLSTAHPT